MATTYVTFFMFQFSVFSLQFNELPFQLTKRVAGRGYINREFSVNQLAEKTLHGQHIVVFDGFEEPTLLFGVSIKLLPFILTDDFLKSETLSFMIPACNFTNKEIKRQAGITVNMRINFKLKDLTFIFLLLHWPKKYISMH